MHKAERKYFQNYAEPEAAISATLLEKNNSPYQYVLCIPAYDEKYEFLDRILKKQEIDRASEPILVIVIANTPTFAHDYALAMKHIKNTTDAQTRTQELVNTFLKMHSLISKNEHLYLLKYHEKIDVLLINRCGTLGIPYQYGVGLARKIANDCASMLIMQKKVNTPILFNTDADACLPEDYFTRPLPQENVAAFLFPFIHGEVSTDESENPDAGLIYHKSLEHYVNGLAYARSPYAYHTVGSTFAISPKHYIQARGYPKRNAGEDFYLLNKLRKLGGVINLDHANIELSSRLSHRIPFGTGPSLITLQQNPHEKIFYHPNTFEYLKAFLAHWHTELSTNVEIQKSTLPDESILENLIERFTPLMYKNEQISLKTFHDRFDAFKTLKLIHFLRDNHFASLSFSQLNNNDSASA